MSFLSRISGFKGLKEIEIKGDGTFRLDVVGESDYRQNIEEICGGRTEQGEDRIIPAVLIPEDNNLYDKNTICVQIAGKTVGYLSGENAKIIRKNVKLKSGMCAHCRAKIRGGWDRGGGDRGHYDVSLDVA
jgi:hypothetical protein